MKVSGTPLSDMADVIRGTHSFGQSIRKNFHEMTLWEKDVLANALYALRIGHNIGDDLAVYHRDIFNNGVSPICSIPYFPHMS